MFIWCIHDTGICLPINDLVDVDAVDVHVDDDDDDDAYAGVILIRLFFIQTHDDTLADDNVLILIRLRVMVIGSGHVNNVFIRRASA